MGKLIKNKCIRSNIKLNRFSPRVWLIGQPYIYWIYTEYWILNTLCECWIYWIIKSRIYIDIGTGINQFLPTEKPIQTGFTYFCDDENAVIEIDGIIILELSNFHLPAINGLPHRSEATKNRDRKCMFAPNFHVSQHWIVSEKEKGRRTIWPFFWSYSNIF